MYFFSKSYPKKVLYHCMDLYIQVLKTLCKLIFKLEVMKYFRPHRLVTPSVNLSLEVSTLGSV